MNTKLNLLVAGFCLTNLIPGFGQATVQFSTNCYYMAENAGSARFTVQRTGDINAAVSVDYVSADGTATAGSDYTTTSGTLTFAAGETNQTIAVPILNDGLYEPAVYESFSVTLSNPTNASLGTGTIATGRITDNDKGLAFEFANYWVREDEGSILIGVVQASDGDLPMSVDFASSNLTATNGLDYAATNGTLVFDVGEKLKLFTVPILNDALRESSEIFRITLSNPTNQTLGWQKTATVRILDNDPGVQFTQNQLWEHENEEVIRLAVARGNDGVLEAFTVDYATANGTAVAGPDYGETHGTLSFVAGEMTRTFTVPVLDDGVAELDEQFKVLLSNVTGGLVLGTATNLTAKVTVCDVTEMTPHRFDNLAVSPAGVVSLTLGGGYTPGVGLVNRFAPYFDIYPLEVSTNLLDWVPLTWLVRTNDATNVLTLLDPAANGSAQRFYRTPARTFTAPQRPPTGPYAVGFTDRTITDDTRRNRYRISTNNSFPITLWYPAERVAGTGPGIYEREPVAREPRYGGWGGYIDRVPYFCGYSVSNAPWAGGLDRLPVVLLSHGHCSMRNAAEEWAEHLASHGYIVVAIDHADSSTAIYPDGTYLYTDPSDILGREGGVSLLQDRVRDLAVVLDVLAVWNENDGFLAGKLDVQNVAAHGFSLGGPTAAEFCRTDPRCRAAVALDPGGYQEPLITLGLQKPSLTMHNPDASNIAMLFGKATTNAYLFQILYTEHDSFCTWYWPVTPASLTRQRESARTIMDWTLWFLNKYLKGSTDPIPPRANYPQIFNFQQK